MSEKAFLTDLMKLLLLIEPYFNIFTQGPMHLQQSIAYLAIVLCIQEADI